MHCMFPTQPNPPHILKVMAVGVQQHITLTVDGISIAARSAVVTKGSATTLVLAAKRAAGCKGTTRLYHTHLWHTQTHRHTGRQICRQADRQRQTDARTLTHTDCHPLVLIVLNLEYIYI